LNGEFHSPSEAIVITENTYIVVASEIGSRKNHEYKYRLARNQNGKLVRVRANIDEIKNELEPQVYANGLNSILYAYAVRIWYNDQKTKL